MLLKAQPAQHECGDSNPRFTAHVPSKLDRATTRIQITVLDHDGLGEVEGSFFFRERVFLTERPGLSCSISD